MEPVENIRKVKKYKFVNECIVLTSIFGITSIVGLVFAFIATFQTALLVPTTTVSTTTLNPNTNDSYAIGQLCQYNYQCPQKAYCNISCQCPLHYYENPISGNCTQRQSYNKSCTYNYQCNQYVGLYCINNTCQCNTFLQFWNTTYVLGNGIPNGRCQNLKVHGMACTGNDVANQIACGGYFGAQTTRFVF